MIISIDLTTSQDEAPNIIKLTQNPTFEFAADASGLFKPEVKVLEDVVSIGYDLVAEDNRPRLASDYIGTINEVSPTADGEFFIEGSNCVSWAYVDGGTVSEVGDVNDSHGIALVDLCPSCTTCEAVYRMKTELENMKMWINTLKDVSLYDVQTANSRKALLASNRITGIEPLKSACGPDLVENTEYLRLKALQLVHQYVTLVHMWNYVVSQNNSSTEIVVAPDDVCGFVVQTKRALPSCAEKQTIQCMINTTCVGAMLDDGTIIGGEENQDEFITWMWTESQPLSVYVPRDESETPTGTEETCKCASSLVFEPFTQTDSSGPQYVTTADTELTCYTPAAKTHSKTISSKVITAEAAGTYVMAVKFLPFVDVVIRDKENGKIVSIRGGTLTYSGTTPSELPDEEHAYNFSVYVDPPMTLPSPTRQQYLDAKSAPTCSVPWMLLWKVEVTWVIDGGKSTQAVNSESYIYKSNGIRKLYIGVFDSDVLPDIFGRSAT